MNLDFSSTEIAIALAAGVVVSCWLSLIAAPGVALLRARCGRSSRRAS